MQTIPTQPKRQLRPYQQTGIDEARQAFRTGFKSVLLVSPTGSGKGTMAEYILNEAAAKGNKSLFIVHRGEIIQDVYERITSNGGHAAIIKAGERGDPSAPIQVCSVQTLHARQGVRPHADFVFWDEAHHAVASSYKKVMEAYPNAKHLGATATPMRADKTPLGDVFEKLVEISSVRELIGLGFLVPCITHSPQTRLGRDLAQDPVEAYEDLANGESAFVFAGSKAEARGLAEQFNEAGHMAVSIDDQTPSALRKQMLNDFRDGEVKVVVNVNTMTEGVDIPSATTCMLAKKMGNVSTFMQAVGRVLRSTAGKTHAKLIDLCGNCHVHGLPEDRRVVSLLGHGISNSEDSEIVTCPRCNSLVREDLIKWDGDGCHSCGFKGMRIRRNNPFDAGPREVLNVAMYQYGEQLPLPFSKQRVAAGG